VKLYFEISKGKRLTGYKLLLDTVKLLWSSR